MLYTYNNIYIYIMSISYMLICMCIHIYAGSAKRKFLAQMPPDSMAEYPNMVARTAFNTGLFVWATADNTQ